jgi:hypothetical protein
MVKKHKKTQINRPQRFASSVFRLYWDPFEISSYSWRFWARFCESATMSSRRQSWRKPPKSETDIPDSGPEPDPESAHVFPLSDGVRKVFIISFRIEYDIAAREAYNNVRTKQWNSQTACPPKQSMPPKKIISLPQIPQDKRATYYCTLENYVPFRDKIAGCGWIHGRGKPTIFWISRQNVRIE